MMMMLIQLRMKNVRLLRIDDASMDTKFNDFAKRHRPTLGRTDKAAYRDAMDASKNNLVAHLGDHLHSGEIFFSTGDSKKPLQRLVGHASHGTENGESESGQSLVQARGHALRRMTAEQLLSLKERKSDR